MTNEQERYEGFVIAALVGLTTRSTSNQLHSEIAHNAVSIASATMKELARSPIVWAEPTK